MEDDEIAKVLCKWHRRIHRAKSFQYKHCASLTHRNSDTPKAFGISVILLSLISAVLSFSALDKSTGWLAGLLPYAPGLCGVLAFALATIQTFRAFDSEAESHRTSAKAYSALEAELEQAQAKPPAEWDRFMSDFRSKWREVDQTARTINPSDYDACRSGTCRCETADSARA